MGVIYRYLKGWQFKAIFAASLLLTFFGISGTFSSVFAGDPALAPTETPVEKPTVTEDPNTSGVPNLPIDQTEKTAEQLTRTIIENTIDAYDFKKAGTVYTFSGGKSLVGIKSGIILDSSAKVANENKDPDLESLMNYPYGGDTASLEFTMVASGNLLNFNYTFISTEFDQDEQFNDIFGLFVSVNGGPYENIGKITLKDGSEVPVNINNLRSGINGNGEVTRSTLQIGTRYSLFNAKQININNSAQSINGISNVFNARKTVTPGDIIKVKFAIADVSDKAYDSYVVIEADSLSFLPPGARVDYEREVLKKLSDDAKYQISTEDETYIFTANSDGEISLHGSDEAGEGYDFMGHTLEIVRKGEDGEPDSDPQILSVAGRPVAPPEVTNITGTPSDMYIDDLEISEDEIKLAAETGQEYSLNLEDWQKPDNTGHVTFSDLTPNTEYTVYTRVAATPTSPASNPTVGTTITTRNMARNLTYNLFNYEGLYDGEEHFAYVTSADNGVEIRYSTDLYGTYTGIIPRFKEPGTYTVYYNLSLANYYPAYGALTVKIKDYDVINTTDETQNYGGAKLLHSSADLKKIMYFTDTEKNALADAGTPAEISLTAIEADSETSEDVAATFASNLETNERLGAILDFNLYREMLGAPAEKLTDLVNPVTIGLQLPDELILENSADKVRLYRVLRLHDGEISDLTTELDNSRYLTFKTDKFSFYAITYIDVQIEVYDVSSDDFASSNSDGFIVPDTGFFSGEQGSTRATALAAIISGAASLVIIGISIKLFRAN